MRQLPGRIRRVRPTVHNSRALSRKDKCVVVERVGRDHREDGTGLEGEFVAETVGETLGEGAEGAATGGGRDQRMKREEGKEGEKKRRTTRLVRLVHQSPLLFRRLHPSGSTRPVRRGRKRGRCQRGENRSGDELEAHLFPHRAFREGDSRPRGGVNVH
jgi:hypothetical protein